MMATRINANRRSPVSSSAILKALGERDSWLREQAGLTAASRAQTVRDLEDSGRREEDTQRDYVGRYPIELLQNAHDACADAGVKGTVAYILSDEALIVANQGKAFDARRVRSLVRQGISEKAQRRRRRTIGYKGVGFSAVFEASASPHVITASGLSFGFDRGRARTLVEQHLRKRPRTVAARNFPFRLSAGDWAADAAVIDELFARGFVTAVRLPLRPGITIDDVAGLLDEQIRAEALVFLPSVRRIEFHRDGNVRAYESSSGVRVGIGRVVHVDVIDDSSRERRSWLTHSGNVVVTREEVEALDDPVWADVAELRATIALPWANRTIDAASSPTPIHLYFPTAETTGRAFLIHGDFHVDTGRSHIFEKGPSGDLNRKLAAAVAERAAELAESVALRHGAGLLAVLATTGTPSAFGAVLNEELDARLRAARIVRPADGSPPRRPNEMKFVSDRDVHLDERLMGLMTKRADLVRVADYQASGVIKLLEALGVEILTSVETARRVTVARASVSYEKALALLRDWIDSKDLHSAEALIAVLRERRILKDINDGWCAPALAVVSIEGVPPLPIALRRVELMPLRSERARMLLEALEVKPMGPADALTSINHALDKQTFGAEDADKQELHDWLLALFRANPEALKQRWPLKGRAPVLARDADGTTEQWAHANTIYFGSGWSDLGGYMEIVYGGDNEPRFIVGDGNSASKTLKDFYAALGVQRLPRLCKPVSPHASQASKWRQSAPVLAKASCPDGHTHSEQMLQCQVLDRLDPILARVQGDPVVAEAFNELLARLSKPYGDDAIFTCENVNHRNKAKPRAVPGYQRWRLQNALWVLVVNDPAGRTQRAPTRVWRGVPRSQATLLLPRGKLLPVPESFEFVQWDRPSVDDLEHALADLQDAFPDLDSAPAEAKDTAEVLLHKLESALNDNEEREPLFLPGTINGHHAWVDDGVVLDLPGLGEVPELPIVHVAPASRIRVAYKLQGAHERLDERILPGDSVERSPLLDLHRRAAIVALLTRRGATRRELARRVAILHEVQVARIDMEVTLSDGRTHPLTDLPFKLASTDTSPILFLNDPKLEHALDLADVLANYFNVAGDADRLALALLSDELARRLHPRELAEATELINSHAEDVTAKTDDGVFTPSPGDTSIPGDEGRTNDDAVVPPPDHGDTASALPTRPNSTVRSSSSADTSDIGVDTTQRNRPNGVRHQAPDVARRGDGGPGQSSSGRAPVSPDDISTETDFDGVRLGATLPRPHPRPTPRSISRPDEAHAADERSNCVQTNNADERAPLPDPSRASFAEPVPVADSDSLTSASPQVGDVSANNEPHAKRGSQADGSPERPMRSRRDDYSETDAVKYVCEYARRVLGVREIRDRQKDRCGWDLELVYPDDRVELVEVKGSVGLGPFEITRNELDKSRKYAGSYVVYFLAQQGTTQPALLRFDDFGERITDEQVRAESWAVIGWRELNPVVIPIELPTD
jgi:hypothetical protein